MQNAFELIDGKPTATKDPGATLDYTLDLSDWLETGETILTASVAARGITVDSSGIVGGNSITLWLSGGQAGTTASAVIRFATSSSPERVDERTLYFKIRNR